MNRPQPLSQYALRVLAEIHTTGIYVWVRGSAAFLNDPQRTRVRYDTVKGLLVEGYLVEDPDELTLSISESGRALLGRNKEAVGRAQGIHEAQQFILQVTGKSLARPNSKSVVHE
jgi:hypothetical protein